MGIVTPIKHSYVTVMAELRDLDVKLRSLEQAGFEVPWVFPIRTEIVQRSASSTCEYAMTFMLVGKKLAAK